MHNMWSGKCLEADPVGGMVTQQICNDMNVYQVWTLQRDGGFRVKHDGSHLCLTRDDPAEGPYSASVHWDWDDQHWAAVEIGTYDTPGGAGTGGEGEAAGEVSFDGGYMGGVGGDY